MSDSIREIHKKIVRSHYQAMTQSELAKMLGKSKLYVQGLIKSQGLTYPREWIIERRKHAADKRFSDHPSDDFIRKNYDKIPLKRIATMIGRSDTFVRTRLKRLGLKVPEHIVEMRKLESRIKPGHVPVNKGKGMSDEQRKKVAHTWFSKGNLPYNTLEDGAVTIRYDKQGAPYKYVRLGLGKWIEEHKLVWERHHGPPQKGFVIFHLNGDSLDNAISNLATRTKAEHLEANIGRSELTDNYVGRMLSPRDKELRSAVLEHPDLIDLKRNQLKLKRQCKNQTK